MKCILCQTETESFSHPKTNIQFHRCPNCDLIFKDPSHLIPVEMEKKLYLFHHNSIEQLDYVSYLTDFIDHCITPFHQGKSVLEFGCGPTPVLALILAENYHFEVTKYDKIFFPDETYLNHKYFVISLTEVIEHIANPVEVFQSFLSLLHPDGIISMMTLFHPETNDAFLEWWYIRDKSHICFYSLKTFEYLSIRFHLKRLFTDNHRQIVFQKENQS